MNFHDRKPKPPLTSDVLLSAFDEGVELLGFRVGDYGYLVRIQYDERPIIKCHLLVEDEEPDIWLVLDESGEGYDGEDEPMPWRGLPEPLAAKVVSAVYSHGSLPKELPWLASIDKPVRIELGHYATEREAALAYDRAAISLYGEDAETNFPAEESEHVVLSDDAVRQINALKAGRGRLQ